MGIKIQPQSISVVFISVLLISNLSTEEAVVGSASQIDSPSWFCVYIKIFFFLVKYVDAFSL